MGFIEDIVIFVFGRSVAEKESVIFNRPERKLFEEAAIRGAEMSPRPLGRFSCRRIECLTGLVAGNESVVIAANVELRRPEHAHGIDDLIRRSAVPDEVAQADDAVEFLAANFAEHRPKRLGIRVKIAHYQCSHEVLRARFFGSSRRMRSTISIGVSSSRISSVVWQSR